MPKIIDKNRVIKMANEGFTKVEIARRLECSERQVRRILNGYKPERSGIKDYEAEQAVRFFYLKWESGEQAAERFGITRQAILK